MLEQAGWQALVQGADATEFWLVATTLLAASVAALYLFARNLRRARLIEDTPTSRVRSAAQGYVELEGLAELLPGPPVHSPLTGARCTWYSIRVEERERVRVGGRRRSRWRTLRSETSEALFLLVDETGRCVIDPDGAEVRPALRRRWHGSGPQPDGPPPVRRGWLGDLLLAGGRYRYTELLLRPGDALYALGRFRSLGTGSERPPLAEATAARLGEWKRHPERHLRPFDADGNNRIDRLEWARARQAAEREVLRERLRDASGASTHVLSRPVQPGRPFLLSAVLQSDLARRYRRLSAAALVAFVLAGGTAAWMIDLRLDPAPRGGVAAVLQ